MNHLTVLDNIRKQRDYLYNENIANNGISSFNTETTSEKIGIKKYLKIMAYMDNKLEMH